MFSLAGKVALITGGPAVSDADALALARRGHTITDILLESDVDEKAQNLVPWGRP